MNARPLSRVEVRDIDRRVIKEFGLPGVVLMENAGRGTADLLHSLGIGGRVVICGGKGNNGGDGFVIGRHLENRGCEVRILLFCTPDELQGEADVNYHVCAAAGTDVRIMDGSPSPEEIDSELAGAEWIVDALLGTGIRGEVRDPYPAVIEQINQANAQALAVDLPSGLDCDTGIPLGCCVKARHTATFVARKLGFDNPDAAKWTGQVHVIDIGVPQVMLEQLSDPSAE